MSMSTKPRTLPVKRRAVSPGVFKRLSAITGSRRQRAATATAGGAETDIQDGSSRISRALTIIFLIHIVAIGLIFVHQKFLDGRAPDKDAGANAVKVAVAAPRRTDLPKLSNGATPYIPKQGDNYQRIASEQQVDETELRQINQGVDIQTGVVLQLPPKRIVAAEPVEVTAIRERQADSSDGLVPAIDVSGAPRAVLVKPNLPAAAASAATGSTYVVKNGDSVWGIANRFKVSQKDLMKANGISNPKKMKIGMKLKIPR
jgi:LysM repeat protein